MKQPERIARLVAPTAVGMPIWFLLVGGGARPIDATLVVVVVSMAVGYFVERRWPTP